MRPEPPRDAALFSRLTAEQLGKIGAAPDPASPVDASNLDDMKWPDNDDELERQFMAMSADLIDRLFDRLDALAAERGAWFASEGVGAILVADDRAREGLLAAEAAGSFKAAVAQAPPTFVVTSEQYGRIARLVEKKGAVRLRVALETKVSAGDVDAHNLMAEIPGGAKKDEIVMVGAHFDSWHTGTGATDNGAGSAVMIEVMRILKTLGLRLDRTVRLGLWSGEEQGLFGSRAYVAAHFGNPADEEREAGTRTALRLLQPRQRFAGGFAASTCRATRRCARSSSDGSRRSATSASRRSRSATPAAPTTCRSPPSGLPGFQFIQDPLDYGTLTHHTSADTLEHAVPADLMQAAAVIASVVYEAANRPERLPRRP